MQAQKPKQHIHFPNPMTIRGQPAFIEASQTHILYFNGCTVVIRSIGDAQSFYIHHLCKVTAAKFSYNYRLVASIDERGTLLINQVTPNKVVEIHKYENFILGAFAIDWTADHKKICAVGSGHTRYAKVISVDTGSEVGQITGVNSNLTTVAFRPERPYNLCVAGDEYTLKFYEGPPYKFCSSNNSHTSFINQIKYNPEGSILASVSSDRKIVLYDGKTGQIIKEKKQAHKGGIMGINWISNDIFVTVSSDKYLRFWNQQLETIRGRPVTDEEEQLDLLDTFTVAVSYCHKTEKIYCLILSNQIREFDKEGNFIRSFDGWRHTPFRLLSNQQNRYFVLDQHGKILEISNQEPYRISRRLKNVQCANKSYLSGSINRNYIFLLSTDQNVEIINIEANETDLCKTQNMKHVMALDQESSSFICVSKNKIEVYVEKQEKYESLCSVGFKLDELTSVHQSDNKIFLGSLKGCVLVYKFHQNCLELIQEFTNTPKRIGYLVTDGDLLFVADSTGAVKVYRQTENTYSKISDNMGSHTSQVTSLLFMGDKIYSFSMDNSYSIWSRQNFMRKSTVNNVHRLGILTAIKLENGQVVTSGGDLLIKVHNL